MCYKWDFYMSYCPCEEYGSYSAPRNSKDIDACSLKHDAEIQFGAALADDEKFMRRYRSLFKRFCEVAEQFNNAEAKHVED